MICDKCGHLMQWWGVYGFNKRSTTYYICRQCGNVRYIEVTKNEQETDKEIFEKQIAKLQLDNDLMRRIIANDPEMRAIYDAFTEPLNVTHTLSFQKFKIKRIIPECMADVQGIIEHTKQSAAGDLFEGIKENITYEIDDEYRPTSVTASIFVGEENKYGQRRCYQQTGNVRYLG